MIFQTKQHDFEDLYRVYIQEMGCSFSSSINEVCKSFYFTPIYPCDGKQVFLSALRLNRSYLKSIILNQLIGEVLSFEKQLGLLINGSPIKKFKADSDEQEWYDDLQAHYHGALTLESNTGSVIISDIRINERYEDSLYWVDLDFLLHLCTYYGTQKSTYQYPFLINTKLSDIKPFFHLNTYRSKHAQRCIPIDIADAVEKIEKDIDNKDVWKKQIAKNPTLIDFYYPFDGDWRSYPRDHQGHYRADHFILDIITELQLSDNYRKGWKHNFLWVFTNPELLLQLNAIYIPPHYIHLFTHTPVQEIIDSPQELRTLYNAFQEGERVATDPSYHTTSQHLFFHEGIDSIPSLKSRTPNVQKIFFGSVSIVLVDLPPNLTHLYANQIHINGQAKKTLQILNEAGKLQVLEGRLLFEQWHNDIETLRVDLATLQTFQENKHTKTILQELQGDSKSIHKANNLGNSQFKNWPFILRVLFKTHMFSSVQKKEIENTLYRLSKKNAVFPLQWSPFKIPELEVLSLDACSKVQNINLSVQAHLKEIYLYSLRDLIELQGLESCNALETFHFEDSNYEYNYGTLRWDHYKTEGLCKHLNWKKLFQQLETLPNLKRLHLVGGKPPRISCFHVPRTIESLYLDNFSFDEIILPTSLKNLTMIGNAIDPHILERATNLEICELKGRDLSLSPHLPKSLKILSLMGKSITNIHILRDLPLLEELHIVMEEFDISAIEQLKELSLNLLGIMIGEINAPKVHLVQLGEQIDISLDKLLDVYSANFDV